MPAGCSVEFTTESRTVVEATATVATAPGREGADDAPGRGTERDAAHHVPAVERVIADGDRRAGQQQHRRRHEHQRHPGERARSDQPNHEDERGEGEAEADRAIPGLEARGNGRLSDDAERGGAVVPDELPAVEVHRMQPSLQGERRQWNRSQRDREERGPPAPRHEASRAGDRGGDDVEVRVPSVCPRELHGLDEIARRACDGRDETVACADGRVRRAECLLASTDVDHVPRRADRRTAEAARDEKHEMAPTVDEQRHGEQYGEREEGRPFCAHEQRHGEAREHGVRAIPPQGEEGDRRDQRRHHEIGVRRRCLQGDDGKRREDERAEGCPTAVESDAGRGAVDRHHCEDERGELPSPTQRTDLESSIVDAWRISASGGKSLIRSP